MPALVARSAAMRDFARRLERAAELDANVLLSGPPGSGKSTMARALHDAGPRARGPFLAVSCAADRVEEVLFGGRVAPARGGTLFLDDVEELPPALQPRLLRMLAERVLFRTNGLAQLDVRIAAATGTDLAARVQEGRFREDLYFRLHVLALRVPALEERREDLPEIAARMLERMDKRMRLSDAAIEKLAAHDWPGNLRELEGVLMRGVAFTRNGRIEAEMLEFSDGEGRGEERPRLAGYSMEQIEEWALLDTLESVGGNKAATARALGVCEKTIYNKLKRLRARKREIG